MSSKGPKWPRSFQKEALKWLYAIRVEPRTQLHFCLHTQVKPENLGSEFIVSSESSNNSLLFIKYRKIDHGKAQALLLFLHHSSVTL